MHLQIVSAAGRNNEMAWPTVTLRYRAPWPPLTGAIWANCKQTQPEGLQGLGETPDEVAEALLSSWLQDIVDTV